MFTWSDVTAYEHVPLTRLNVSCFNHSVTISRFYVYAYMPVSFNFIRLLFRLCFCPLYFTCICISRYRFVSLWFSDLYFTKLDCSQYFVLYFWKLYTIESYLVTVTWTSDIRRRQIHPEHIARKNRWAIREDATLSPTLQTNSKINILHLNYYGRLLSCGG